MSSSSRLPRRGAIELSNRLFYAVLLVIVFVLSAFVLGCQQWISHKAGSAWGSAPILVDSFNRTVESFSMGALEVCVQWDRDPVPICVPLRSRSRPSGILLEGGRPCDDPHAPIWQALKIDDVLTRMCGPAGLSLVTVETLALVTSAACVVTFVGAHQWSDHGALLELVSLVMSIASTALAMATFSLWGYIEGDRMGSTGNAELRYTNVCAIVFGLLGVRILARNARVIALERYRKKLQAQRAPYL